MNEENEEGERERKEMERVFSLGNSSTKMPSITPSQRQTGWLEQSLRNCPPKSRDLQVVARNVLITKWMEEDSSV